MNRQWGRAADSSPSPMGLASACAVVALVVAPSAALIASISEGAMSSQTLVRAAIAGGICWLAASLALTATYLGNQLRSPVQGMLLGMLFRMGLPLGAIVALPALGGPLAPPGIAATILGVYFVTLVVETVLSLRMLPLKPQAAKAT